jgi:polar amino acid transport system substrate-binding protein
MLSKCWVTIILFLCISFAVSATERTIIINDVPWPPYFFIDAKDDEVGIGKEILNYCLAQAGYKVRYGRLPIKRTHHYMEFGLIDLTVYSYRQSREEILYYSKEPIFSSEYGFLVRADSGIDIKKLDDVKPYQIGHLAGLTYTVDYMNIINEKIKLDQVTIGHSLESMFLQLLAPTPRFDIMADSKSTFNWFAHKKGVFDQIKVLDYTLKNKEYFITISKRSLNIENPLELLSETDACIKKLKQDGSYKAILTKYGQ